MAASVQELILAAQAKQKKSPLSMLADLVNAGSAGYTQGVKQKKINAEAEDAASQAETRRQALITQMLIDQQRKDNNERVRAEMAADLAGRTEEGIRTALNNTKSPGQPVTPRQKVEKSYIEDEMGNIKTTTKIEPMPDPKQSIEEVLQAKDDAKLAREKPKAKGSLTEVLREYDNMIKAAEDIKNDKALPSATGLDSFRGKIKGTEPYRVHANMNTLKSKTLISVLSGLKQLSSTGASGFGSLSELEGEGLKSSVSSLDLGQNEKDVKDSLDRFVAEMKARKETLKSTYENTYGESFDGTPSSAEGTSASSPGKIRVKRKDGKIGTINETDFNPETYERLP
jgi:hypothetical protein